jgi:hypothetical protein
MDLAGDLVHGGASSDAAKALGCCGPDDRCIGRKRADLSLDCVACSPMYNASPAIATGAAATQGVVGNGASTRIAWNSGGSVSARVLPLLLTSAAGSARRNVQVDHAVIAGWTGRDAAAVEKHIAELEALGVKRPATTPIFYRVAAARLTTDDGIEVLGEHSSGEVEFVLLQHADRLWVGTGSDHTDREVEKYGVSVSKQICEKPVAAAFWPYDEVAPHWERLVLRAHIYEKGQRTLYQEGPVTAMLDPLALVERYAGKRMLTDGTLMFCGTLAARGGVRASEYFDFELEDQVRARKIHHRYRVRSLPVLG